MVRDQGTPNSHEFLQTSHSRFVARREELLGSGLQDVELAKQLASRFVKNRRLGVVAATLHPVNPLFAMGQAADVFQAADPIDWLKRNLQKTDVPFFGGMEAARAAIARIPALTDGRFLVAIAARETTPHKHEERAA